MPWRRRSVPRPRSTRRTLPSPPSASSERIGLSRHSRRTMSVSVRIPTILRTYTGGESEVSANGDTLAAVLDDLDDNYSGIKGRIVDEQGELRRFVNVYVGNDDVRFLENLDTKTPEGTQISVIPAVAGG